MPERALSSSSMISASSQSGSLGDILLASSAMCSTDTFDLSYCLAINAGWNSPLPEASFSVHSLPTVSSADSIPPFPTESLAHKVHVETYLSMHQPTYLGYPTSPLKDYNRVGGIGVLLAAPTVPRLRDMVKEPLHIKKWLNGLVPSTAISIRKAACVETLADGPSYTPGKALKKKRPLCAVKDCEQTRRARINRNALVFEREIKSGSERGARISIKVPTTAMNTEDVLSRKQLNANFNTGNIPDLVSVLYRDSSRTDGLPTPPSLMVSTSDAIFPISLDSSSDVPDQGPQTLAARRGKKTPPHLSLKKGPRDESYPSIPTAFLGVPSDCPAIHGPLSHDSARMDLQSMVSTLQSRRVSTPFLPVDITNGDSNWSEDKANLIQKNGSDDWAPANAFVTEYGDLSLGGSSCPATASFIVSSTGVGETDSFNTSGCDMSMSRLDSSILSPIDESSIISLQRHNIKTPPQEVKGILKGCKNVHFASLPNRKRESQQLERQPGLDKYVPLVNSARTQGPQPTVPRVARRPSTVSSGLSVGRARPPNPFRPGSDKGVPPMHKPDPSARPASTPSCIPRSGRTSTGNMQAAQRHSIAQPLATASRATVTPSSRLRSVSNAGTTMNKENDKRLSTLETIDENAGRRDSSVRPTLASTSTKKKIQVPLRNIFTRFK